ncbi:MAG: DJ-1/PfpI family protein, partial [Bacteroidales bacterium]|nr:DJ-1/PfpI family protein [Bacteroidales bacterium]
MKVYILLAQGFEIAEAMLPLDILRRARVEVYTVSIGQEHTVTASNGTPVVADKLLKDSDLSDGDMLFLPGGMPGSNNL